MPKGIDLQGTVFANDNSDISHDLFTDKFIEFIEANGWYFGGGSKQVDYQGNYCDDVPVKEGTENDKLKLEVDLNSPRLIRVTPTRTFQLILEYPDAEIRLYDAIAHLSGKSSPVGDVVEDLSMFMTAHVIEYAETVGWANEVDLDPDVLYLKSVEL